MEIFSFFNSYVFILTFIAFLYCFTCVDESGTDAKSEIKRIIFNKFPKALKSITTRICGRHFVWVIERIFKYICYEPNPIVQIAYFICAFGGFYVYVKEGFPQIPNERMGVWHCYVGTLIMGLCYTSYFMACWTDPGRLDKDTPKDKL